MPAWAWIVLGVAALAAIAYAIYRMVETRRFERRFRGEYDATVDELGSRRKAETELRDRARRRKSLDVVPLTAESQRRYTEQWQIVQGHFVDAPVDAVHEADVLITSVMRERGYPVEDFDRRAADVSVDHPEVVGRYRAAHTTYERGARASTEELREAMIHFRSLFENLVGNNVPAIPVRQAEAMAAQSPTAEEPDRQRQRFVS